MTGAVIGIGVINIIMMMMVMILMMTMIFPKGPVILAYIADVIYFLTQSETVSVT